MWSSCAVLLLFLLLGMVVSLCSAKIVELLKQFYKRYFMTLNLLLLFEKVTSNFDCFLTNFIIIEPIKLVARAVTDILEILL